MTTVYRDNAAKLIANRSELLPVVMVVGLALSLRLCQLGAESLWIDEGFSLRDATHLSMLKETRPLYFLILAGWLELGLGRNEFLLRLPSVLFGTTAVWVLYALGRRVTGTSAALLASFFMAISVLHVNHSQEVRMYSLVVLTSLVSTYFLLLALERRQARYVLGYGFACLATLLTFPLGVLVLAAHGVFLLLSSCRHRRRAIQLGLIQLGVVGVWMPWFTNNVHASAGYAQGYTATMPGPTVLGVVSFLGKFFLWKWSSPSWVVAWGCTLVSALLAVLAVCSLAALPRRSADHLLLWTWLTVPVVGLAIMSRLFTNMWMVHYLIFASPAFFLIIAHALNVMPSRVMAMTVVLAISFATLGRLAVYYVRPARAEWRPAVRYLEEHERPGDVIVLYYAGNKFVFDYYYTGKSNWAALGETTVAKEDFGRWDDDKVEHLFDHFPLAGRRFWLVLSHHTYRGGFSIIRYVKRRYRLLDYRGFHLLEMYLFDARGERVPRAAHRPHQTPSNAIVSSRCNVRASGSTYRVMR